MISNMLQVLYVNGGDGGQVKLTAPVVQVNPPGGEENDVSGMKSLSGGECSFLTVCFMLSLWDIAESAFRCLDEFDVCMVSTQKYQKHQHACTACMKFEMLLRLLYFDEL